MKDPSRNPPRANAFCVDEAAWNERDGHHGEGWKVTGTAPNITVEPSINMVGHYHGYIRDGVITDDCEGRTFPAAISCADADATAREPR